METSTKIKSIEVCWDITNSFKVLHNTLNNTLWCCADFPHRTSIMKKYRCKYYPENKTLEIKPFKKGIIKNIDLISVEVSNIPLHRVDNSDLNDIISYLILNNLSQFNIEGLLANRGYLGDDLNEEVFNKLELIKKLRQ